MFKFQRRIMSSFNFATELSSLKNSYQLEKVSVYGLVNCALFQEQTNFIGKVHSIESTVWSQYGFIILNSHHDTKDFPFNRDVDICTMFKNCTYH